MKNSVAPKRPQLPALTGLRFFAALFVMVAHASQTIIRFEDTRFHMSFGNLIVYFGMSLFFVLSGFVIHYNYKEVFINNRILKAFRIFYVARFARLYPLFFFFFLVCLATVPWVLVATFTPILKYYVLLVQSWGAMLFRGHTFTQMFYPHSWSISTEMFFYVFYPVLFIALMRIKSVKRLIVTAIIYFIVAYLVLMSVHLTRNTWMELAGMIHPKYPVYKLVFYNWLGYFSPYVRILEFIAGCLAAELYMKVSTTEISVSERRFGNTLLAVTLGVIVFLSIAMSNTKPYRVDSLMYFIKFNFIYAPWIAALIFCSVRYENALTRFLGCSLLVGLGEISYSIYLIHPWTIHIFTHTERVAYSGPMLLEWLARMLMVTMFTIAVSVGTYRVIEVPCRKWIRNTFGR